MPSIKYSRRRSLLFSAFAVLAGIFTITACSTEENPPAGTVSVAVTPTSINVAHEGTGSAAASITRGGGFSGPVTLSQSGAPTGMTVTFTPSTIAAAATASTINVGVGAAVPAGPHAITISAAGDNVTTATTTLTVVVIEGGAGSISLAANPTTLTVAAGAAAVTSTITITRTAPFAGPVGFTVTGAPTGVTAAMSPVSAAGATSTLSVSSTASAVNGTYPLVVHGAGVGIADATVTVNATVTGGSAQGIAFTFAPASLPITAGGASGNSTVTIAKNGGFAGTVNLALTGQPTGLTATVTPSTNVSGTTATITAQATAAVPAGTYDLTLTGTGTGIPNATGTLPVVVTGASGGGSFSTAFCAADAPIWVAAQDGSGAWTRVNPTSGSTYSFTFASGKGGIAVVDTVGTGYDLSVIYGTVAEFTAFSSSVNLGGCGSKIVNGSVANVGATEAAIVSLGYSTAFVIPALSTTFQLTDVADGNQDMIASRIDATTQATNKLIIRRGLNIPNNGSLAVLDFNAAESFAPGAGTVTVTGLGADHASILALYTGTYGSTFGLISSIDDYTTGAVAFSAVPVASLSATELQQLIADAEDASNANSTRAAGVFFRAPAAKTVAMGAVLSTPTVTKVVTAPNARPRVQLASQASYNRLFTASYDQGLANRSATIAATAGYFGSLPATWDLTLPDLSGAAGWNSTWGLQDGTAINWDVSAQGGAIQFLDGTTIVDGATFQSATISSATPLSLRGARSGQDQFSVMKRLTQSLHQQVNPLR